jgi:hypothetical protein
MPRKSGEIKRPRKQTSTSICLNPFCRDEVTWNNGRPPSYCKDTCLKSAQRAVRRLSQRLADVTAAESKASEVTVRNALASERRTLCWELQRYAGCLLDLDGVGRLASEARS